MEGSGCKKVNVTGPCFSPAPFPFPLHEASLTSIWLREISMWVTARSLLASRASDRIVIDSRFAPDITYTAQHKIRELEFVRSLLQPAQCELTLAREL